MKTFLAQVQKIWEEFSLNRSLFEQELGIKNTGRWGKTVHSIDTDTLLLIVQTFHKSLDWLVYGKEPVATTGEHVQESYEARPLARLEADLMNQVMQITEEILSEKKKKLSAEEKTRLITRVYNDCAEDRIKPDKTMVIRYLWVIAGGGP